MISIYGFGGPIIFVNLCRIALKVINCIPVGKLGMGISKKCGPLLPDDGSHDTAHEK